MAVKKTLIWRRRLAVLGAGLVFSTSTTTMASVPFSDRYYVLYSPEAHATVRANIAERTSATVISDNAAIGLLHVQTSSKGFLQLMRKTPGVEMASTVREAIEYEQPLKSDDFVPDDAYKKDLPQRMEDQWEADSEKSWWKRQANVANTDANTGEGVTVAVLEAGVNVHPDLPNVQTDLARSFGNDDHEVHRCDENGCPTIRGTDHGTHVSGIIGAAKDGKGISGIAPGVKIVPMTIQASYYNDDISPTFNALVYAANTGVDVVNMSYGKGWLDGCDPDHPAPLANGEGRKLVMEAARRAVSYARDHGVTIIKSAGNSGKHFAPPPGVSGIQCTDPMLAAPGVIGVGALTPTKLPAHYTNFGPNVDIMAPGGAGLSKHPAADVLSTYPESWLSKSERNGQEMPRHLPGFKRVVFDGQPRHYTSWAGTSMATPVVTGIAAWVIQELGVPDTVHGGLSASPDVVTERLLSTASPLPHSAASDHYGPYSNRFPGLVNGRKALGDLNR